MIFFECECWVNGRLLINKLMGLLMVNTDWFGILSRELSRDPCEELRKRSTRFTAVAKGCAMHFVRLQGCQAQPHQTLCFPCLPNTGIPSRKSGVRRDACRCWIPLASIGPCWTCPKSCWGNLVKVYTASRSHLLMALQVYSQGQGRLQIPQQRPDPWLIWSCALLPTVYCSLLLSSMSLTVQTSALCGIRNQWLRPSTIDL